MNGDNHNSSKSLHFHLSRVESFPGVTAKMVLCTPELSRVLLELNTHNRKISQSVVEKYVREILNGEWYACPAGVGVDDHGVLLDGQHRLSAIEKSGKTVPILIVLGLPAAAQQKVDRQNRRTLFDVMVLAGIEAERKAVQIATVLARRATGSGGKICDGIPADSDVKRSLEVHRESTAAILKMVPKNKGGLSSAGVMSAFVVAHEKCPEETESFIAKVVEPSGIANDDPRWRFYKWTVEGEKKGGGGKRQYHDFCVATSCMNAFFAGKKMLAVRSDDTEIVPPAKQLVEV